MLLLRTTLAPGLFLTGNSAFYFIDTARRPEATVTTPEASFSKPAQLQFSPANFRPDSQSQAFPP
jgi:hypothetical protein